MQRRACAGGAWDAWSECVDLDVCIDGRNERDGCGLNERGTQIRICEGGQWSDFGACEDADVCADGAVEDQDCGRNGNGIQSRQCVQGQWTGFGQCNDPDICVNGEARDQPCGINGRGTQSQVCVVGQWGPLSACEDTDVCRDGLTESEACGADDRGQRRRECLQGQWGDFGACEGAGECADGAREARQCGLNERGEQSRECVDGVWQLWGECADPDVCIDDDVATQACGINNNGEQQQRCQQGQWGDFGDCDDPDECRIGDAEEDVCGINDRGVTQRRCGDGQWSDWSDCRDPDECLDGATEERDCAGGVQARTCNVGQWGDWSACGNPDDACFNPLHVVNDLQDGTEFEFDTRDGTTTHQSSCEQGGAEQTMQFTIDVASRVVFDVTEASYDTLMFLRSECADGGTELACNDDREPGDTRSRIATVLQPGTYFLFVDGYRGDEGTSTVSVSVLAVECNDGATEQRDCPNGPGIQTRICANSEWGDWSACFGLDQCSDAFEENNTPQTAVPIALNSRGDGLSLCRDFDSDDYYAFSVDEPTWVSAQTPNGDWTLTIETVAGAPLGVDGLQPVSREAFLEAGDYLMHFNGDDLQAPAVYSVGLFATAAPLCGANQPANDDCLTCTDAAEPNGSFQTAQRLNEGDHGPYETCGNGRDEQDWYRIDLERNGVLEVSVQRTLGVGRVGFQVYSRGGLVLEGTDDGNGLALAEADLGRGSYWIVVFPIEGALRYDLSLAIDP